MDIQKEASFYVDGMESYLHCLSCSAPAYPADYQPRYHFHEYIELLYYLEGEGTVWVSEIPNPFCAGTLIIINSGKAHDIQFKKPTRYICVKFSPHILYGSENPFQIFKYAAPFLSEEQYRYILSPEQLRGSCVEPLLLEIIEEWQQKKDAYSFIIRANILKIFATVFRIWRAEGKIPAAVRLSPEIKEAVTYTAEHFQTATLQEVSQICGLSYNYFSRLFHRQMGIGFQDYLILLRIGEAEKLLLTTSKNITEVAEETGFSATSHFVSCFRSKKGVTPAKFRQFNLENRYN